MTPERAAFINELQERAGHSQDGGLLNRAAAYLIGDETDQYQALVAVAAARREAERPDLNERHQAQANAALAKAEAALKPEPASEPEQEVPA